MDPPEIRRFDGPQDLSRAVASSLVSTLRRAQEDGRVPAVALTGGTIAVTIHEAVAASPDASTVDWSRVDVWFGDERYVASDDAERNEKQAAEAMLDHLPFDPARIHPMPASDAGFASLDAAATAYGDELRERGTGMFDVVMLGLGPDGHVASLFPGFAQLDVHDAIAVPVIGSPKPPPERISLTFDALNRTREVWFVVSGDGKADAVAATLAADGDVHRTPARGVTGSVRTVWFVDEEAASRL